MRILVLGGTRFFGLGVVRWLAGRGVDLTVLSRRQPPEDVAGSVRFVEGDRRDPAVLGPVMGSGPFDAVFDNVARTGEDVAIALDLAKDRVGHFVLTSTGSVCSSSTDPVTVRGSAGTPGRRWRAGERPSWGPGSSGWASRS